VNLTDEQLFDLVMLFDGASAEVRAELAAWLRTFRRDYTDGLAAVTLRQSRGVPSHRVQS
jgi:hypothetical protein